MDNGDNVARIGRMDQTNAAMLELAHALGSYYLALITERFTAEQAFELVAAYQEAILASQRGKQQ